MRKATRLRHSRPAWDQKGTEKAPITKPQFPCLLNGASTLIVQGCWKITDGLSYLSCPPISHSYPLLLRWDSLPSMKSEKVTDWYSQPPCDYNWGDGQPRTSGLEFAEIFWETLFPKGEKGKRALSPFPLLEITV